MKNEMYIHIGLPKAASTFLQGEFFPKLKLKYIGRNDLEMQRIINRALHDYSFCDSTEVKQFIDQMPKALYSHERLGSYANIGALQLSYFTTYKKLFRNPKILLIIRRQDTFAESLYKDTVGNGSWKTFKWYIGTNGNNLRREKQPTRQRLDKTYLHWNQLVKNLYGIFGEQNVLVLPYEMLIDSYDDFAYRICDFMKIELPEDIAAERANESLCYGAVIIRRFLNRFINNETNPFYLIVEHPFKNSRIKLLKKMNRYMNINFVLKRLRIACKRKFFTLSEREEFMANYRYGNKTLSTMIQIDLSKYGYHN